MKISIIVPVYNVSKYIKKCLNCLVNQKFKYEYEIILVNDYSSDNSLSIINRYKKKFSNIIIINKNKTEGPGKARNQGLKIAKGDYVFFLDSYIYI